MAVGYGNGGKEPPAAARIIMSAGSEYEMTDPDGWHYVRPIGSPTMSLMIAGKPWDRPSLKSEKALNPLRERQKEEILKLFREHYSGNSG